MRASPEKAESAGPHSEEDKRSKLYRVIQDDNQNDPEGILYVVLETVQEIDTSVHADNRNHSHGDQDTDFRASPEVPASCAVDGVGPLLTNEEVSVAIQRNGSQLPISGDADRENQNLEAGEGIFGTSVKPSKWSLSRYLQSVASTREKRMVAVTAWLAAFAGLIVAIVFVTLDFVDSRKELASTVRYEDSPSLDLPPLWLCTIDSEIPPFMELPNETYRGKPLFWLDYVRGTNAEINVTYPKTKDLKQLSLASYDMMGRPCSATEELDPRLYFRENMVKPSCFYCLTLNRDPPFTIQKNGETEDGIEFSRLASLRIAQNSFTSECRMSQFGLSGIILRFFREELRNNHAVLSERGIVDFGEYDPSNRSNDGLLWPSYRFGLQNTTVDFVVYDIVDMFCNVYLFSGFFYPSTSQDIRYKFDSRILRWKRSGAGPYYPRDYFEYYTESENIFVYTGTSMIGQEKYENRSMYDSSTIEIRTNHSRMGGAETIAVLRPGEVSSVRLSRNWILERESYTSHVERTDLLPGDVRSVNKVYLVDIGFKSFLTRVVSDQHSVSWSAFIADFFGLTSLFMDVSVYTLIVAPLIMRGRRRALEARKRHPTAQRVIEV